MTRKPYEPPAIVPSTAGPLTYVLFDRWFNLPSDIKAQILQLKDMVTREEPGFYVRPGTGCDIVAGRANYRCGDTACAWYVYRSLEKEGVLFGVRACSEHKQYVVPETAWSLSSAKPEDFLTSEVMTT